MPLVNASFAQALDSLAGAATPPNIIAYAGLFSAWSATGTANELTGGSPAYARQTVTWSAASGNSKASSAVGGAFNVPAAGVVAFVGLFSALTSGTFAGMGPNGGSTQYAATCTLASPGVWTAPGSAYSNGQTVVLFNGAGSTIPAAYTVGTIYYVVSVSGATFQLSATSGGSGINTAAAGAGIVQAVTVETFAGQGTFSLTSETLSLF